jgi:hypothetical protein
MELITPNFIGMYDDGSKFKYTVDSNDNIVMIKILDFDISCNAGMNIFDTYVLHNKVSQF